MVSCKFRRFCTTVLWLVANIHIHWIKRCRAKIRKMRRVRIKDNTGHESLQVAVRAIARGGLEQIIVFIKNIGSECFWIYSFLRFVHWRLPVLLERDCVKLFGGRLRKGHFYYFERPSIPYIINNKSWGICFRTEANTIARDRNWYAPDDPSILGFKRYIFRVIELNGSGLFFIHTFSFTSGWKGGAEVGGFKVFMSDDIMN